jgi:hypothetical protein
LDENTWELLLGWFDGHLLRRRPPFCAIVWRNRLFFRCILSQIRPSCVKKIFAFPSPADFWNSPLDDFIFPDLPSVPIHEDNKNEEAEDENI